MSTRARDSAKPPRVMVGQPADVAPIVRALCNAEQETFVVVCVDVRNRMIDATVIALGTVHSVEVHPRDVFRHAIRSNAAGIILAHNHPSGDATPSAEDLAITRRLKAVGDLVGIPVLDHVVVTIGEDATFRSIAEVLGDEK